MRDILRSVTGNPKNDVVLKNIHGRDFAFSFNKVININNIATLVDDLIEYYENETYKENFDWVDNIRRVTENSVIQVLEEKLIEEIINSTQNIIMSIPEVIDIHLIEGFSFTRAKNKISSTINIQNYLATFKNITPTIQNLKSDKLFLHHDDMTMREYYLVYDCIYCELHLSDTSKLYILFNGFWYEIEPDFNKVIKKTLSIIPQSKLQLPDIYIWEETEDNTLKEKIEKEGDYNARVSDNNNYYLLDKKLIKSNRTTSSIELCDLITSNKELIHVKHKKYGSSALSHLFAQGTVSAEILLADQEFRKKARAVLKIVDPILQNLIPVNNLKSSDYEVVFVLLDEDTNTLIQNLPFFSKINLLKAYENLTQRGFKVSICGVKSVEKPI